jgi:ribonuclease BN (tRNA processing enzyme)
LPTVANTKDFIKYTAATNGRLFIKTGNLTTTTKMQTRIIDASGRLVRSADTRYSDQSVDLNGLARGSYVLKIFGSRGEQYTRQFIY